MKQTYWVAVEELTSAVEKVKEYIKRLDELIDYQKKEDTKFSDDWNTKYKIHHTDIDEVISYAKNIFIEHRQFYTNLVDEWPTWKDVRLKASEPGYQIDGEAERTRFLLFLIQNMLERCVGKATGYAKSEQIPSTPTNITVIGSSYPTIIVNSDGNTLNYNAPSTLRTQELETLIEELDQLRTTMRSEAMTAEQDVATGYIANAAIAAKAGDDNSYASNLKAAGKWALSVANKIGISLVEAALKAQLGL